MVWTEALLVSYNLNPKPLPFVAIPARGQSCLEHPDHPHPRAFDIPVSEHLREAAEHRPEGLDFLLAGVDTFTLERGLNPE